jgi:FkbM family methyltransferase
MLADVTFPSLNGQAAQPPMFKMYTHDILECAWISKQLVEWHQWEPFLVKSLMMSLKASMSESDPKPIFVDIGTNIGAFSLSAAASGATVVSIEPLEYNTELYLQSIKLNGFTASTLHKIALSDFPSSEPLCFVPFESFAKKGNLGNVRVEPMDICRRDTTNQTEVVHVTTLDELLPTQVVTAVKIDVEGHEYAAMAGAKQLLGSDRAPCHIQFEYVHFRKASERGLLFRLLEGFSYKCQRQMGNKDAWQIVREAQPPQGEYRCFHVSLARCEPVLREHELSSLANPTV